ncbi:hypothetical protein BDZ97DRAFT_2068154 [Flammula alnicola]|nr:hypothetical protein BDZ97DRAFT_2068154 [Flammula alnicola]
MSDDYDNRPLDFPVSDGEENIFLHRKPCPLRNKMIHELAQLSELCYEFTVKNMRSTMQEGWRINSTPRRAALEMLSQRDITTERALAMECPLAPNQKFEDFEAWIALLQPNLVRNNQTLSPMHGIDMVAYKEH